MFRITDLSRLVSLAAVLLALCGTAASYRVLLMPEGGRSHVLTLTQVAEGLVARGHEAFMMLPEGCSLPDQLKSNASGIKVVYYGEGMRDELGIEDPDATSERMTERMLGSEGVSVVELMRLVGPLIERRRRRMLLNNDALLDHLRTLRLDMAVVDQIVFLSYSYLIPHSLGVPWMTFTDKLAPWFVRVPYLPSFVPSKFLAYTERMGFKDRVVNTVASAAVAMYLGFSGVPEELEGYQKYGEFSSMADLMSRSVLFIDQSDIALDYPTPSMPNVIHAGGLSVKPSTGKPLPSDIEQFMGDATSSVILVTFGSMVSTLPSHIANRFLDAFRGLSECRIIWRFKNTLDLALPDNVMVRDWLPQNDILADPRVKLFVTHGGSGGQFEAVYHGVPMIGFPLFGDQHHNTARLEYKSYGKAMDIHAFTAEELADNARSIIGDSSYKSRVSKASEIFKSARETAVERVAYWIEHVIKFGGEHLRSAGSDLALYQYLMLDVLLVVGVVIVTSLVCAYKLVRLVCRKCRRADGAVAKKKAD